MPVDTGSTPEKLTRREALKRGAVLGGALLWTTPAVQAIGMSRALAEEPSVSPCTTYCMKYEFDNDDPTDLSGKWVELGNASENGRCFVCPPDSVNGLPPAELINAFTLVPGGSKEDSITVRYPGACSLPETMDPSPDLLANGFVAAKCGQGVGSCNIVPSSSAVDIGGGFFEITVSSCSNGAAISHIEMIIKCC